MQKQPYQYAAIPKRKSLGQTEVHTDPGARQTGDLVKEKPVYYRPRLLVAFGVGMCLIIAVISLWNLFLASWVEQIQDNWQYGASKTFQMDAVVGHEDSTSRPTHLIAFDLHSQVTVIEIPGGNAAHTHVYTGLTILEGGEQQRVITLSVDDVNSDGKPDLIIHIEGMSNTPILFNTGTGFSWTDK